MTAVERLDARWYPGSQRNWDDLMFRDRILARLRPDHCVLDLGAGAGIVTAMDLRGHARRICGVDPDPRVRTNPFLDDGVVGTGEAIPYPDQTFDLVVADNVLEHLDDPLRVFAEVSRVLVPTGHLLAKTPNAWHYIPLIARLTPHRFHRWVNQRRGRAVTDTFPTRYRANTPAALRRLAAAAGLAVVATELIEGRPEYLRMSSATYLAGLFYERLVNSSRHLSRFRVLLIADLVKSPADHQRHDTQ